MKDTLSSRMREALDRKGIKPAELSKITGIDKSRISCYLSGRYKPKKENGELLAKALGVTAAWLMGYDVPSKQECEAVADDIKSGKIIEPAVKRDDIPEEEQGQTEADDDIYSSMPDDVFELISIYQSFDDERKKALMSYAHYLEEKSKKTEDD